MQLTWMFIYIYIFIYDLVSNLRESKSDSDHEEELFDRRNSGTFRSQIQRNTSLTQRNTFQTKLVVRTGRPRCHLSRILK